MAKKIKQQTLVIDETKYYVILLKIDNKITKIFNNKIYLGKYLMLAYNQIPNNSLYEIKEVKFKNL